MLNRFTATLLLVLATVLWGLAFIAQKTAMGAMGPLTFIAARYLLGGVAVLPLGLAEHKRAGRPFTRTHWVLLGFLSLNFFLGSYLQQAGLVTAAVINSGFLTGLYVFFVPLVLLTVFRTPPHPIVWLSAPLALAGLYLLTGADLTSIGGGDLLVISSALFWGLHVLFLGHLARETGQPIFVSALSFLIAGLGAALGALAVEGPTVSALANGWVEIVYAGLFSTAIAFTLQAVGQVHVPPANAAIILSGEALFAALGGTLVLGERLTPTGYMGAALLFAAMVLVETVPALTARPTPSR